GDEAVHNELGDRMERAATTTSSLEAKIGSDSGPMRQDTILGDVGAQTRFEITSKQSNDPPLSIGYTLGSGEDCMKLLELMEFCTQQSYKNRKSVLLIQSSTHLVLNNFRQLPRYRQLMEYVSGNGYLRKGQKRSQNDTPEHGNGKVVKSQS
ncbi:hypothetical protein Tco_0887450, partial [Tanacetum coccineum]